MAYQFDAASSQRISAASALNAALPWTFAGRYYKADLTNSGTCISIADTESINATYNLVVALGDAQPNICAIQADNSNSSVVRSYGGSAGQWGACAGIFASNTSRSVFLDGGGKATDTSSRSTNNSLLKELNIGALRRSSLINIYTGLLAECAVWSVALTDGEIASLAKGFSPRRIRPKSLVFYAPLIRDLQDTKGGLALTNNNSATVANHPRVY